MHVGVPGWRGRLSQGRAAAGADSVSRGFLTQEQFQEELVVLGLSDQTFGPREYAEALGARLCVGISIEVVPDTSRPLLSRELARTGITGEIIYDANQERAHVIVPGSLPPLALVFTILHELGHLAAGDLFVGSDDYRAPTVRRFGFPTVKLKGGRRLAQNPPLEQAGHREHEADLRAGYAFVAGCLGSDNPYAQRMYDIL